MGNLCLFFGHFKSVYFHYISSLRPIVKSNDQGFNVRLVPPCDQNRILQFMTFFIDSKWTNQMSCESIYFEFLTVYFSVQDT